MNKIHIELGELENSCFVVMPFAPLYQTEYEKVIQPTLQELNIVCKRGDEIYSEQRIMDDIWKSIRSCRFVLAELTGRNPNVLYEVGLAHAIGKPVIIITRNSEDVPFDLKDLRYLFYNTDDPFWGDNLRKGLKALIEKVIENPEIENYLSGISKVENSEFPKIEKLKKEVATSSKMIDISGNWIGSWDQKGNHDITLQITQNKSELSGIAIVSFDHSGVKSVVQEVMNGTIKNLEVKMNAVNYTYIERGVSANYNMDSFNLFYNVKEDSLSGFVNDDRNLNHQIILKRI